MENLPDPIARSPDEVLLRHRERFLASLAGRVGGRAAAEDLLHAAWVRALERGAPEDSEEGIVAWFHTVLRNGWLDQLRRRGAEDRALARHAREAGDAAAEIELHDQTCECLHDLLPALRPEYAEVLRAVDLEGRAVAEVARDGGLTKNATHVRLHRARQALKRELLRACGACAHHGCLDCGCGSTAARPAPRG